MPWNETDRTMYAVVRERDAADLSDAEFAPAEPQLLPTKPLGRKRHLAVDTLGLPTKEQISAADVQDRDALPDLLVAVIRKSPRV